MKKLLFILFIIPTISFGQSVGTYFLARNYIKAPIYFEGTDTLATKAYVRTFPFILGSGTTNYVPYFTSSRALGTSPIYISSGNVGIGTATLPYKLTVDGSIGSSNYVKSPYFISGSDTLVQWNKRGTGAVFLGNVSIGTSTLGYSLNLRGDVNISIPNNVPGKRFSIETHSIPSYSSTDAVFLIDGYHKFIFLDETDLGYKVGVGGTLTERFNVDGNISAEGYLKQEGIFGEIWSDGADAVVSNSSYQPLDQQFSLSGESSNTSCDHTAGKITITKSGRYMVYLDASIYCAYDERVKLCLIVDGVATEKLLIVQNLVASKYEHVGSNAIISVGSNIDIKVGIRILGNTPRTLVFSHLNLNLIYIGE